jgi:hypothetical protein
VDNTPVVPVVVDEPVEIVFSTDDAGEVIETVVTETETFSLTIEEGTVALDGEGEPIESITITEVTLTDIPENIISVPYEFEPSGSTFEPPFELVWTFNHEDITDGETPVVMYFDGTEWIEVDGVVDFENGTITAKISHFTKFAVFAREVIDSELPEAIPDEVEPVIEPEVTEPEVDIEIIVSPEIDEVEPVSEPEETIEPVKARSYAWVWLVVLVVALSGFVAGRVYRKRKVIK